MTNATRSIDELHDRHRELKLDLLRVALRDGWDRALMAIGWLHLGFFAANQWAAFALNRSWPHLVLWPVRGARDRGDPPADARHRLVEGHAAGGGPGPRLDHVPDHRLQCRDAQRDDRPGPPLVLPGLGRPEQLRLRHDRLDLRPTVPDPGGLYVFRRPGDGQPDRLGLPDPRRRLVGGPGRDRPRARSSATLGAPRRRGGRRVRSPPRPLPGRGRRSPPSGPGAPRPPRIRRGRRIAGTPGGCGPRRPGRSNRSAPRDRGASRRPARETSRAGSKAETARAATTTSPPPAIKLQGEPCPRPPRRSGHPLPIPGPLGPSRRSLSKTRGTPSADGRAAAFEAPGPSTAPM